MSEMMMPPMAGPPSPPDDDAYERARRIFHELLEVEKDPADRATIANWIRELFKIQANNQKMMDDGLAGKFSPAAMRKLGG